MQCSFEHLEKTYVCHCKVQECCLLLWSLLLFSQMAELLVGFVAGCFRPLSRNSVELISIQKAVRVLDVAPVLQLCFPPACLWAILCFCSVARNFWSVRSYVLELCLHSFAWVFLETLNNHKFIFSFLYLYLQRPDTIGLNLPLKCVERKSTSNVPSWLQALT